MTSNASIDASIDAAIDASIVAIDASIDAAINAAIASGPPEAHPAFRGRRPYFPCDVPGIAHRQQGLHRRRLQVAFTVQIRKVATIRRCYARTVHMKGIEPHTFSACMMSLAPAELLVATRRMQQESLRTGRPSRAPSRHNAHATGEPAMMGYGRGA